MNKNKLTAYTFLTMAMVFWGFSYIWLKTVYQYLPPVTTTFFRLIIATVFLVALSLIMGKLQKINKKDISLFILLALFEPFLYYMGESYGVSMVSPTVASIVISMIPLFLPFSMYFLAREPLSLNNFWGIAISFIGVLMVVLNNDFSFSASPLGLACLLSAVASVMGYSYFLVKLASRYNAFTIITVQNFLGIFFFLPAFFLIDFPALKIPDINSELILNLCALGVFASAMAFFLFTLGIQRIGVIKATIFTYIIPVITAVFSFLFLNEIFTAQKMLGIFVVIAGLFLSQVNPSKIFRRKQSV
ncbi:MAG: DMT family transporter [Bacteroidota bacterium]